MRGRKRGGGRATRRGETNSGGGEVRGERRDAMFVKERYGEPEVPRDEERGREGPGWRGGGGGDPDHVSWSAY